MTPLERAKSAIARELGISDAPIESFALPDGRMIETESLSRAVLQAIREPSERMVKAMGLKVAAVGHDDGTWSDVYEAWQSAIDAALEEG